MNSHRQMRSQDDKITANSRLDGHNRSTASTKTNIANNQSIKKRNCHATSNWSLRLTYKTVADCNTKILLLLLLIMDVLSTNAHEDIHTSIVVHDDDDDVVVDMKLSLQ